MAKYTINFSCGHSDVIELFGKEKDRRRKIEYLEDNGICKECYKKQMIEQEENTPLNFNVSILPYINQDNGSILLSVWFAGNTKPYKEEIKKLKYMWCEREDADIFALRGYLCWNKVIELDELDDEIKKAESIGARNNFIKENVMEIISGSIAWKQYEKWVKESKKIKEIEKPKVPEKLKGHRWNQKVYGKKGNYSIYPDGEKTFITDDEADEIKKYLLEKEKYKKKVEKIKNA